MYSLPDHVVRELSDAKNGPIKAKGRVECVGLHHSHQPIHPHGNVKGGSLFPVYVILENRRLKVPLCGRHG